MRANTWGACVIVAISTIIEPLIPYSLLATELFHKSGSSSGSSRDETRRYESKVAYSSHEPVLL